MNTASSSVFFFSLQVNELAPKVYSSSLLVYHWAEKNQSSELSTVLGEVQRLLSSTVFPRIWNQHPGLLEVYFVALNLIQPQPFPQDR